MINGSNGHILPSKNAPKPEQFLKEVNHLMPFLQANGVIPTQGVNGGAPTQISRAQAKQMGFKNAREANSVANEKYRNNQIHEWRAQRIGETVEREIKTMHPLITRLANMTGWMWLYKLVFLSWNVKGGVDEVEGIPGVECSWVNIYRFGKPIKIIRLVWEDHNKKRKVILG